MPYRANPSHPRAFPNFQFYSTLSHLKRKPPPLHPLFCFLSSLLLAAPDLVEASFLIEFRGFENLAVLSSLSFFLHSFISFKLSYMPYAPSQRLVRIFQRSCTRPFLSCLRYTVHLLRNQSHPLSSFLMTRCQHFRFSPPSLRKVLGAQLNGAHYE